MAKENNKTVSQNIPAKEENKVPRNYKKNVTMFIIGLFIIILGFLLLTKTNKGGDNWASYVSAFSIIGGYIVVALSLIMDFPPSSNSE